MCEYVPQQKKTLIITSRQGDERLALTLKSNTPICTVPPVIFFLHTLHLNYTALLCNYASKIICAALFFFFLNVMSEK